MSTAARSHTVVRRTTAFSSTRAVKGIYWRKTLYMPLPASRYASMEVRARGTSGMAIFLAERNHRRIRRLEKSSVGREQIHLIDNNNDYRWPNQGIHLTRWAGPILQVIPAVSHQHGLVNHGYLGTGKLRQRWGSRLRQQIRPLAT